MINQPESYFEIYETENGAVCEIRDLDQLETALEGGLDSLELEEQGFEEDEDYDGSGTRYERID